MKTRLTTAVSAAALAAALLSGPAVAQSADQQLIDSVSTSMAQFGMDTAVVDTLDTETLIEIEAVLNSTDDENMKERRIEQILMDRGASLSTGETMTSGGAMDTETDPLAADQVLQDQVASYLAEIGLSGEIDASNLTTDQLSEIYLLRDENRGEMAERKRVQDIVGIIE